MKLQQPVSRNFEQKKRKVEILNISTVSISPHSLCPTSLVDVFAPLDKTIDFALALELSEDEKRILQAAGHQYHMQPPSINQTVNWTSWAPMFADCEVKIDQRDPLIQLATWIAAHFEKRTIEGYPTEVPVPAIAIYGDLWHLWIAYCIKVSAKEKQPGGKAYRVQFLGPIPMGSTEDVEGVFRILYFLKKLVKWGFDVYEPRYLKKVLARYQGK
ncbi:MAG: hypothetical protein Q9208_007854 [Pyrenodesmia sp. 3 TL-2023]